METDYRLVCDACFAYRGFAAARPVAPIALRDDPVLGAFVAEHEDCEPPLRVTSPDDAALERYRENYEEA
jgi:hypothetical protein